MSACSHVLIIRDVYYKDKNGNVYYIQQDYESGKAYASFIGNTQKISKLVIPSHIKNVPVTKLELNTDSKRYKWDSVKTLVLGKNIENLRSNYSGTPFRNLEVFDMSRTKMTEYSNALTEGATKLKTVIFNDCIETIKAYSFSGCSSLEMSSIPNSVTRIEDSAFSNCPLITSSLKLSDNLIYLGKAFDGTGIIDSYYEPHDSTITLNTNSGAKCLISVGYNDFSYNLSTITIPGKIIGSCSFSSVLNSDYGDYSSCTISFPDAEIICSGAAYSESYYDNEIQFNAININKAKYIGGYALRNLATNSINLPATLKEIGENCFAYGLKTISVASNNPEFFADSGVLYHIGENGCEFVYIPDSYESENLTINSTTRFINLLSYNNQQFEKITIWTETLESLKDDIKNNFYNLRTYAYAIKMSPSVPPSIRYVVESGSIIRNNTLLISPSLHEENVMQTPGSATTIGSYSLMGQSQCTIQISRNVTTIEKEVFTRNWAINVYIPNNVITIIGRLCESDDSYGIIIHIYIESGCNISGWSNDWNDGIYSENIYTNVTFDY